MKTIGIKLADGTFYPVLQENSVSEKKLDLTTANNNQTKVMVDLYRSTICSMEDAEYVDSLQIENLVAHPNGEPDITFTVSIDENNELSAKIVDTETGNQSKTTITLVSRTQEERLITDEYNIADSKEKTGLKKAGAGLGLLAAAAALREKEDKTEVEFTPAADMDFDAASETEENTAEQAEEPAVENFDIPEETAVQPVEEPVTENFTIEEEPSVEMETPAIAEETPDFDFSTVTEPDEPTVEETSITEEVVSEDNSFDLDLPDFPEEPAATAETVETEEFNMESESLDLPDFPETTEDTIMAETEIEVEEEVPAPVTEEPAEEDTSSFDLDLPDFEDTISENTTAEDDPFALPEDKLATTVEEFPSIEDDFPAIEENSADAFSMDDDFSSDTISETNFDDTFSIPEPSVDEETDMNNNDFPDDFFDDIDNKSYNDDVPAGKGLSFTGLYDKETELGTSSYEEDDTRKKTKAPVIICIICAIICILATALILFIVPSKYNLLKKGEKAAPEAIEVVAVEPEPIVEEEPEPVPEAKEEEVIIIEKAEEVVPEQPPVAEEKPKDITYKIKWGDTLWDISETYYKNPWRYKYIARFNKIKNPDYIISGTYITIPAE